MRLHLAEHQDIMNELQKAGIDSEMLLTKKNGWVHIKHHDKIFSFHRKKVTHIENRKFVDSYEYYTGTPRQPLKMRDWQQVTDELRRWLT